MKVKGRKVSIVLPADLAARLVARSRFRGLTLSETLRALILQGLDTEGRELDVIARGETRGAK